MTIAPYGGPFHLDPYSVLFSIALIVPVRFNRFYVLDAGSNLLSQ